MHGEQAPDLDLVRNFTQFDLHALAVGELDAEAFAVLHIILRDLHAALGEAEPAHAMRQARGAKPHLRHLQPVADAHEDIFVGDFEAVESQLAHTAMLFRPERSDPPHDAPARLVLMKEKRREPAPLIVRGARDENEMRRLGRAPR